MGGTLAFYLLFTLVFELLEAACLPRSDKMIWPEAPHGPRKNISSSPEGDIGMHQQDTTRRKQVTHLPKLGAVVTDDGGVDFRVWAPKRKRVELCLCQPGRSPQQALRLEMTAQPDGYFATTVSACEPGSRYGYRLDGSETIYADPVSRFQPAGVFELSEVIDPRPFPWTDKDWHGIEPPGQVIYELHIGTYTPEGTWRAAAEQLPELAAAGMTAIEVMPVAEFPGRFGWGYDGVFQFAPTRLYGRPDDFRFFVDRAHALNLAVILDVVYNHFGPVGNYLHEFSDDYVTSRYENDWNSAINFDGPHSRHVREFFRANIRYWINEFHLDGFRFDATQAIYDESPEHILAELCREARQAAAPRRVLLAMENEPQDVRLITPLDQGGFGADMIWNDDFHHSARVRQTGACEAYYSDFRGTITELAAAVKSGFIYQGQRSIWQEKPRGTPTRGFWAGSFVSFLENHDQISNSGNGRRTREMTSPGRHRAMTALWLLGPQTPLFFQDQEFGASSPFLFFADFAGDEAEAVRRGRAQFLAQFPSLATPEAQAQLPDPGDPSVFERCIINLNLRKEHGEDYALHKDLLKLRREDPVFSRQRSDLLDVADLNEDCLVVRYFTEDGDDRLLVVNFGSDFTWAPVAQPLLAPPAKTDLADRVVERKCRLRRPWHAGDRNGRWLASSRRSGHCFAGEKMNRHAPSRPYAACRTTTHD